MKRKIFSFVLVIVFVLSIFNKPVHAYANLDYYNSQSIKIGLETMKAAQITVLLNGDYSVNGTDYISGTSFDIKVNDPNLEFIPKVSSDTLTLKEGGIARKYIGSMLFTTRSGMVLPINTLNIEEYLKGVVGYEMSDYFPIEALKAQAVAARNYAIANKGKAAADYDLGDGTNWQVYKGYDSSLTRVIRAVEETKGVVLLSGSSLVEAYYSASDGGYTEASENVWSESRPYLKEKQDDFDVNTFWNKDFTSAAIDSTVKQKSYLNIPSNYTFNRIVLSSITKYPSGRISNITLIFKDTNGTEYTRSYNKEYARIFLSLPSAMYDVTYDAASDTYKFNGKGNGHGIGMSQIGAQNRANSGQTYDQILNFYYDGTAVKKSLGNIKTITPNKDKVYLRDYLVINTEGQEGSGQGFLYKYVVEKSGTVIDTRDFSEASKYGFIPKEIGDYIISVYLKDKLSQLSYEDVKTYSFTVSPAGEADINLDNTVDIFDMVSISRNIGKQRSYDPSWNERWNLDDSNAVIDILDLAKAAELYNKRY